MPLTYASKIRLAVALLLTTALLPLQSHAGQASGQMPVSLTIVDSCQIDAQRSADALSVKSSQCAPAASYRVMYDAQGQQVDRTASAQAITQVQAQGDQPTRVTLYW
ncbi:hypothetical protein A9179_09930 [Pseudomonas alcaligenes]|uniref:Uncharacterized protein n=1 Tax=Aquipseudomonas alcaligenes TaxID=43263 RepID=A0ABR7S1K2_AQUAC|nr:hypothetical protein [Pseudomonas alcaligenes]MBC9250592.1 hypothetical protein [Pseudomonas alcaligenes]